ncbi:somatoliberin [Ctenodactylus gundi]
MPLWVLFFFMILTLSSGSQGSPPFFLPLRMRRYADAIFTNSYRKVLGQLSARKLLRDIMSRQQGEKNHELGAKSRLGRQVDSVWANHKQVALDSMLVTLLQKPRSMGKNIRRGKSSAGGYWAPELETNENNGKEKPPPEKAGH